jgi:cytosine/adenosine deaminase-related metal-dependent hydrolase
VLVRGGRIEGTGPFPELRRQDPRARVVDLGNAIVLPGLVNAHTHLSLTSLQGVLPPGTPYLEALREITLRASALTPAEIGDAARAGAGESWRRGTSAVGEITTRPEGTAVLAADGRLLARVYFEFLGVTRERAERRFTEAGELAREWADPARNSGVVLPGLSPHAPYSVWPGLWGETALLCRERDLRWSTHLAESAHEEAFLEEGQGPLREHLESLGVWDGSFPVPGRGIFASWEEEDVLDARALLVHGVHLRSEEIARIATRNASVCLCPRSNAHLDLPPPPAEELHAARVNLCLGTDSLATNRDLGIWGEMRALARIAPRIPPSTLIAMATWNGACALGVEDGAGSLGRGRRADFLAVPTGVALPADPHRFLLEADVEADLMRPLDSVAPSPPPG